MCSLCFTTFQPQTASPHLAPPPLQCVPLSGVSTVALILTLYLVTCPSSIWLWLAVSLSRCLMLSHADCLPAFRHQTASLYLTPAPLHCVSLSHCLTNSRSLALALSRPASRSLLALAVLHPCSLALVALSLSAPLCLIVTMHGFIALSQWREHLNTCSECEFRSITHSGESS